MANAEDERLSSEEGSTLEELRNKLARVNLPISRSKSVLMARLNRAYKVGQSAPKESERDEESANQRDLRSGQRAERNQDGDEDLEKLRTKELRARLASLGLKVTGRKSELRARLRAALEGDNVSSGEESDDKSDDEEDKKEVIKHKRSTRAMCSSKGMYHFGIKL